MNLNSTTALICAGVVLAGCGSSGSSSGSVSASNPANAIYTPNFRDADETEYDALTQGLVYYIGATDGSVSEFLVQIDRNGTPNNPNDDELIVRKNGGAPKVFTPLSGQINDTGSVLSTVWVFKENTFDEEQFQVVVDSNNPTDSSAFFRINFPAESIGPQNFGRGGLETQVNALPPGTATYSGSFNADRLDFEDDPLGAPGQQKAVGVAALSTSTTNTVVDFATGTISGNHNGTSFLGATNETISGVITGTVAGTRAGGTLSITDGATGTLNFGGLFTGPTANNLSGGVGGTVQQDGTSHTVGGDFRLGQ